MRFDDALAGCVQSVLIITAHHDKNGNGFRTQTRDDHVADFRTIRKQRAASPDKIAAYVLGAKVD